jgi:hypothetical protein
LDGSCFGDANASMTDAPFQSSLVSFIVHILFVDILLPFFQMHTKGDGESVDLLQLYGVKTQLGRFAALVMDNIFSKEELTTITKDELLRDERYQIIKG